MNIPERYWESDVSALLSELETSPKGLTETEVNRRLSYFGRNILKKKKKRSGLLLFLGQFKSPIILILIFASTVSAFLKEFTDTAIILTIILASGFLSFTQEYSAANAVEKLLDIVKLKVSALRDGKKRDVPLDELVPGDVVFLSAGSIVPADCVLTEVKDLFVNEAMMTGETFPVEKIVHAPAGSDSLQARKNCVFMGTSVESGFATALVVGTGARTEIGRIADRLILAVSETDFERGVRRFGYLLLEVTFILILIVFALNVYFHHPVIDALLFSLALAVGLTPQLLPAIISVNLSKGSQSMSRKGVIIKRLNAIENFGTMDILCTDKTGTLTEGRVLLQESCDAAGDKSDKTLLYAYLNASFQTGMKNPIDDAIVQSHELETKDFEKIDEIPYDFERKRLSIVLRVKDKGNLIIAKGALGSLLSTCATAEVDGKEKEIRSQADSIHRLYHTWSEKGLRIIGVAYKSVEEKGSYSKQDESDMTFLGFLLFLDPPKDDAKAMISALSELGVNLKIITGDNRFVSRHIAETVGFRVTGLVTGEEIRSMSDEALMHAVENNEVFTEVNPNQKERIILSLRKRGHVVGFLGDGINDAPAIHAADVGISVNTAVDVAKEAADVVLLEKGLETVKDGLVEGRKTFANTLKYVFMATSANFGNMFSVAGASLFLSFLPMLPIQILLTNLLTDVPEMTIATDEVDPEMIRKPRKWDIGFIKKFMVFFGLLSSLFDYVTFGVLLFLLGADPVLFRTGWFIESVLSASLVVLVIRTRKPFFRSRPSRYLLLTTLLVCILTPVIPYLPFSKLLGFGHVPPFFLITLALILLTYVLLTDAAKRMFYARIVQERDRP